MQIVFKIVIFVVLALLAFKLLMILIPAVVGLLVMLLPWAALALVGYFIFKTFQKYQQNKKYGNSSKIELNFMKKAGTKVRSKSKDKSPW